MKSVARPEICPADRFQRRTGGAPDWDCQWPKGACSIRCRPTGAQPVVLMRLVLRLVSSMKTSLSSMLAMSGWRASIQTLRRPATSGRRISLVRRGFFMAEAKPVQPSADRAAMHAHPMHGGQFGHELVQRQVALGRQPRAQPGGARGKLARTKRVDTRKCQAASR